MAFRIEGDRLTVNSHYAWAIWILCGVFLCVFPPAIIAMWRAAPEKIPLWVCLFFTLGFSAFAPYLIGEIVRARLVRASLDRASGVIRIAQRGLFARSCMAKRFDEIERIEMRTTDNDGEFHGLHVVFRDGTDFAFRHGNCREYMEEERDRFLDFVRRRRPEVGAVERFVPM